MDDNTLLPLERWLKRAASISPNQFPDRKSCYFTRYKHFKDILQPIYDSIGAGTSAEDGGIYTGHGPNHFDDVIDYAGKLLGLPEDYTELLDCPLGLTPYEVFILLTAILLHDAGNVEGRLGHETRTEAIFNKYDNSSHKFERRFIAEIAKAHGGKFTLPDGKQTKDTIGQAILDSDSDSAFGGISYRPKLIAALTRFADEICEDSRRAARHLLEQGKLPEESILFHKYAASITSSNVYMTAHQVHVKYQLCTPDLLETYLKAGVDGGSQQVFLIDEIYERLKKMFSEMIYCSRFMRNEVKLEILRATIEIFIDDPDSGMTEWKKIPIELKEQGYPAFDTDVFRGQRIWSGKELEKEVKND